ncbi:ABC transporter ATP-binding protein [Ligilactobacillus agilis]|uniref:ABC transporter ATP-binding protein n=1 Tax=Ligilactobacillus agilis TaxID=1601 RepID=UPI0014378AAD|nr:ABC transporter ATP-binding protein [Ligilactobacillus agilis]GET14314.1 ABC transporter ATP-binding protein [Ligilactobacillus agilis]
MTLEVTDLVGGYSQIPVLKQVSFTVAKGQLVGLIGLNGAGKSTTINHIIGLLRPQKGSIKINGVSLSKDSKRYKQNIAYVPESPILYEELTLKEHIDLTIMAYNLDEKQAWRRAQKLLTTFRLDKKLDWFPANFSKGMKQKVMIVCAFLTDADLFIIDEPFLGLDPLAIRDLLALIAQRKAQGAAILMSTHVLDTAQNYCDKFVLLNEGRVTASGSLAELQAKYGNSQATLADLYLQMIERN